MVHQPARRAAVRLHRLVEAWRPKPAAGAEPADWLLTCCIVTTTPNALIAPIDDCMPVTLSRDPWDRWLSRELQDPAVLAPMMQSLPAEAMQAWPVARTVNRGSAEGAALIAQSSSAA